MAMQPTPHHRVPVGAKITLIEAAQCARRSAQPIGPLRYPSRNTAQEKVAAIIETKANAIVGSEPSHRSAPSKAKAKGIRNSTSESLKASQPVFMESACAMPAAA